MELVVALGLGRAVLQAHASVEREEPHAPLLAVNWRQEREVACRTDRAEPSQSQRSISSRVMGTSPPYLPTSAPCGFRRVGKAGAAVASTMDNQGGSAHVFAVGCVLGQHFAVARQAHRGHEAHRRGGGQTVATA
eukprot:1828668-Rhodomonas_salina.1